VSYTYDAWGNLLSVTGDMADGLGALNPLRYRGYVYDTETGLYYLGSRYYNPAWGRFINADTPAVLTSSAACPLLHFPPFCGKIVRDTAIGAATRIPRER
ncbi:MAG: RHS repeat-associated core domain-containing protein, partial [Ruminococcaceae bacterium]|nr:RHS repeat-associated core domain-containing protein [Oscillospiraceae bacterium]